MLLAMFTISQAPADWLHDCFADHTHTCLETPHATQAKLVKAQLKCHCMHVAHHDTPYLVWGAAHGNNAVTCPLSVHYANLHAYTYAAPRYFFSIQGPPVA